MIKDTQAYKDGMKLYELHQGYKKHSCKEADGARYGHHVCDGCGMPFDISTGLVEGNTLRQHNYGGQHGVAKLSDAHLAMLWDLTTEHGDITDFIDGNILRLRGKHDLLGARDNLLRNIGEAPYTGYAWVKYIAPADSGVMIEALTRQLQGRDNWRSSRRRAAQAIFGICLHTGKKAPRRELRSIISKLPNMAERVAFADYHGVKYANVISVRGEHDSAVAYDYIKLNYPDKFKDEKYMVNILRSKADYIRYLRDEEKLLVGSCDMQAIATKFLPGKFNEEALTPMYAAILSGDKERIATHADGMDGLDVRLMLSDSMDDMLKHMQARRDKVDPCEEMERVLGFIKDEDIKAI